MGLKELIERFHPIKVLDNLRAVQAGQQNIYIETVNISNLHIPRKVLDELAQASITDEINKRVKQETTRRLSHVQKALPFMSTEASEELVVTSTVASLIDELLLDIKKR